MNMGARCTRHLHHKSKSPASASRQQNPNSLQLQLKLRLLREYDSNCATRHERAHTRGREKSESLLTARQTSARTSLRRRPLSHSLSLVTGKPGQRCTVVVSEGGRQRRERRRQREDGVGARERNDQLLDRRTRSTAVGARIRSRMCVRYSAVSQFADRPPSSLRRERAVRTLPMLARAVRRMADTALSHCVSLSRSFSLSLSLSLGWRRLLLSAAWESQTHCCSSLFSLQLLLVGSSQPRLVVGRPWKGVAREEKGSGGTQARSGLCVCTMSCADSTLAATAVQYFSALFQ